MLLSIMVIEASLLKHEGIEELNLFRFDMDEALSSTTRFCYIVFSVDIKLETLHGE